MHNLVFVTMFPLKVLFLNSSSQFLVSRNNKEYTECPRRNVPDFGRMFLMLKYTDITQNTYVQSWTVTEIIARKKCDLLVGPRTVPVSWQPYPCPSLSVVSYYGNSAHARSKLLMYFLLGDKVVHISAWHSCHVYCLVTLRTTMTWVRVFL